MASSSMAISFSTKFSNRPIVPRVNVLRTVLKSVQMSRNAGSANSVKTCDRQEVLCGRLAYLYAGDFGRLFPLSALGSGLQTSIEGSEDNNMNLKNVKIVIESRDEDNIHVRVDVGGEDTQRVFDNVLTDLARTAPPVPGFRRKKGGKTTNVPKSFLLQILGRDRVRKFVIQEIVSSTMADYVKKEALKVKSKFNTTQTIEELESAFTPGSEFGFNATMEIEKAETETTSPSSMETDE